MHAAGYRLAEIDSLRNVLAYFRSRILPDLLLDVALAEALLDGPDAALESPFSLV